MDFLRTFEHLLPRAQAFRLTIQKQLREFFEGLAAEPAEIVTFTDDVYDDLFPETTRELDAWEEQFALAGGTDEADRRQSLAGAWQAVGGQSPRYLQDVVQAAGFNFFIHEWWSSASPFVPRDPRLHTVVPLFGTVQCGEALAQCGEETALCNAFLANDPGYLVNLTLVPVAPPPVPDDPAFWPFFLYFGGAVFPTLAPVPLSRRDELERLLLRYCPPQNWIVLLADFVAGAEPRVTLSGDPRVTLSGDPRETLELV